MVAVELDFGQRTRCVEAYRNPTGTEGGIAYLRVIFLELRAIEIRLWNELACSRHDLVSPARQPDAERRNGAPLELVRVDRFDDNEIGERLVGPKIVTHAFGVPPVALAVLLAAVEGDLSQARPDLVERNHDRDVGEAAIHAGLRGRGLVHAD